MDNMICVVFMNSFNQPWYYRLYKDKNQADRFMYEHLKKHGHDAFIVPNRKELSKKEKKQ